MSGTPVADSAVVDDFVMPPAAVPSRQGCGLAAVPVPAGLWLAATARAGQGLSGPANAPLSLLQEVLPVMPP
jgi:hypothetical protein